MAIETITLRLSESRGGFRAVWIHPRTGEKPQEPFAFDDTTLVPETELPYRDLIDSIDSVSATLDDLEHIGRGLFQMAGGARISDLLDEWEYQTNGTQLRLAVQVEESAAALQDLPWELLYDDRSFLARRMVVVRHMGNAPRADIDLQRPLRALIVSAAPETGDLHFCEEAYAGPVRDELRRAAVEVVHVGGKEATQERIKQELETGKFQLFHFVGHGAYQDGSGYLIVRDEDKDSPYDKFPGSDLGVALKESGTQFAFLESCQTGRTNRKYPFRGVAANLIKSAEVRAVVAMQYRVDQEQAGQMTQRFYKTLTASGSFDLAIYRARTRIKEGSPGWGVAALYAQYDKGTIRLGAPTLQSPADLPADREQRGATPSRLTDDLSKRLTLLDRLLARHAVRRLEAKEIAVNRVHEMLSIVQKTVDEIRHVSRGLENSDLADLSGRLSRMLDQPTSELYELILAVPVIPLILGSPERTAISSAGDLKAAWRELTRVGRRFWVILAVVVSFIIGAYALQLLQDPALHDSFGDTYPGGAVKPLGKLDPEKWDFPGASRWDVKDSALLINSPGCALFKLDRLRSQALGDFDLKFTIQVETGTAAEWILRAQPTKDRLEPAGYRFQLNLDNSTHQVSLVPLGNELKLTLDSYLLSEIRDYQQETDALEIHVRVTGATFQYDVSQTAVSHLEERESSPHFGGTSFLTFTDTKQAFRHGTVALMGSDSNLIRVYGFQLKPNRRLLPF